MTRSRTLAVLVGIVAIGLVIYLFYFKSDNAPEGPASAARTESTAAERKPAEKPAPLPISTKTESPAPAVEVPATTTSPSAPAGSLVGRVIDDAGAPVSAATVSLYDEKPNEVSTPIASVKTDDAGRFRFGDRAAADGLAIRIEARDFLRDTVDALAIRAGEKTDVGDRRLRPGARLSGVVVDPDGAAIAGAEVRNWGFGVARPADEAPRVTDDAGHFRIGGLAGGTYGLNVEASGFAPGSLDDVSVKADQEVSNLRVVLQRGLSISGHVFGPDGAPIAAARVRYNNDTFVGIGPGDDAHSVETDASGHFELRDVPAMAGRVLAKAAGFADASASAAGGATDVVISLVHQGSIHGRVVDANTGAALASFVAWADRSDSERTLILGIGRVERQHDHEATVEGSTDGTFTIAELDPGTYSVHAVASGFAEAASESIVVTPAPDVAETQLSLVRGGSILGIVVEEETNKPISGTTITASRAGKSRFGDIDSDNVAVIVSGPAGRDMDDLFGSSQATTKTGDDGKFELRDLPAGKYRLRARQADHANGDVPGVEVVAGENAGPITITLGAAGAIEGLVSDVDRAPAVGARVSVRTVKGFSRSATTGDDGHYAIRNLAPGTYFVQREAESSGATFMAVSMVATRDGDGGPPGIKPPGIETRVVANQTAHVDFSDADLGAIAGRVLDGDNPVEGASVELTLDGQFGLPKLARTDSDGRYDFDRLDPGAFALGVRVPPETREIVSEKVAVTAGRRIEKDLPLPNGSIEGVVLDMLTHRGIEGAVVRVESQGDGPDGGTRMVFRRGGGSNPEGITTDRDGKFRVGHLAPGKYRVTAAKEGFGQDSKGPIEVSKSASHVTGTEIQLGAGGTLVGRVVDSETGTPIEHANIQGRDSSGGALILSEFVQTDSDGRFRITGVRPGTCSLTAFSMGYQPWSGEATIAPNGNSTLSISLLKNR
ncbi:MAG: carboxypeptidase regulatory-like domain-containing protein [Planctomycetes bacterium]|nr:carboxypeptidase regulatory-like domain-containing protein [Planctomycetota bacterium]MBI3844196.1 carboxypeptidase regulatory-like domain-containing protein [Planctomycetota bacterium]